MTRITSRGKDINSNLIHVLFRVTGDENEKNIKKMEKVLMIQQFWSNLSGQGSRRSFGSNQNETNLISDTIKILMKF